MIRLALIALAALGAVWTAERAADTWDAGSLEAPLSAAQELVQTVAAAPPFAHEPRAPAGESAPEPTPGPRDADAERAGISATAGREGMRARSGLDASLGKAAMRASGAEHHSQRVAARGTAAQRATGEVAEHASAGSAERSNPAEQANGEGTEHATAGLAGGATAEVAGHETPEVETGTEIAETGAFAHASAPAQLSELQPLDARTAEAIRCRLARVMDLAGKPRP